MAPAFTWTGLYVGLNAGGAWNSTCGEVLPDYTGIPAAVSAAFPSCNGGQSGSIAVAGAVTAEKA
jgi:hypothetical protein